MFAISDSIKADFAAASAQANRDRMARIPNHSPEGGRNFDLASTLCENGRMVKVVHLAHKHDGSFYAYDVLIIRNPALPQDFEVAFTCDTIGEALSHHYRIVTKYGGPKESVADASREEKERVIDEIINELNKPNQIKIIEQDKAKVKTKTKEKAKELAVFKVDKIKVDPRLYNWQESIVDCLKVLGLGYTSQARRDLAGKLGWKGNPHNSSELASMNQWLLEYLKGRYGDWIEEATEAHIKSSRKRSKKRKTSLDIAVRYIEDITDEPVDLLEVEDFLLEFLGEDLDSADEEEIHNVIDECWV